MAMVSADKVLGATLGEAKPGDLVLVQQGSAKHCLVAVGAEGEAWAIMLDGDFKYRCFPTDGNEAWAGVLVKGLRVEVDTASANNLSEFSAPLGSLIREHGTLSIKGLRDGSFGGASPYVRLNLETSLPAGNRAVSFNRWRLVGGEGVDKAEVFSVDLTV